MDPASAAADYRANGYVVLPGALSPDQLAGLRAAVETLLAEPPDDDGGGRYHDIGRGEARRFLRHRHADLPAVAAFLFGDTVRALARALIGPTPYLFNEQFVVKGAGAGASFAWHQDGGYVGFAHRPYLTLWIALDDATEANGCVYVLPRNLDADPGIAPHAWDATGKEMVGYDGPDEGVALTCPAGTIVAFSSTTLHRSGENRTQQRRRAYVCQFTPEPLLDPATGKPRSFAKPLVPDAPVPA